MCKYKDIYTFLQFKDIIANFGFTGLFGKTTLLQNLQNYKIRVVILPSPMASGLYSTNIEPNVARSV